MACITCITGLGIGLTSDFLNGSASFIIDTQNYDAFIKTIDYSSNFCEPLSSSIKYSYQVSNYSCDFDDSGYTEFENKPEQVDAYGRYVKILFEFSRDSIEVISPRVMECNVNFEYNKLEYKYNDIYKLKYDIYGYQYALIKPKLDLDIYNYKFVDGKVIVKNLYGDIITLRELIPNSYKKYEINDVIHPNLYTEMISGIKDIEIFYDTMMFITSSYVVIEKSIFNYDNSEFSIDETFFKYINLNDLNLFYSDVWFFEKSNEVLMFFVEKKNENNNLIPTPVCYKLNLVTGEFFKFNIFDLNKINTLSSFNIKTLEAPVLTYDNLNNNFNMGVLVYNENSEFNILSIDIKYDLKDLFFDSYSLISPVDYYGK
jgi:hypothetical protein